MEAVADRIPNPLRDRITGCLITMPSMVYRAVTKWIYHHTDFEAHEFVNEGCTKQELILTFHSAQLADTSEFITELETLAAEECIRDEVQAWWSEYFDRSYIHIALDEPETDANRIGRNYQLFRFMMGCNYYGQYPTKLNGGFFTFDDCYTPDFRKWSGNGFTAQNQRHLYWGMLKSSDFDGMLPQLNYYRDLLDAAKARTDLHLGIKGAFFREQGNLYGLAVGGDYLWDRDPSVSAALEDNPWVRLHFSSGLEFALMCLEYGRYAGRDISEYLDFIESVIRFYFEYYSLDEGAKLHIFPSTALETFKGPSPHSRTNSLYGCSNPMDAVAGLRTLITELISYYSSALKADAHKLASKPSSDLSFKPPSDLASILKSKIEEFALYLEQCPELPLGLGVSGSDIYLPASDFHPEPFNCELPQLYRIFPFSPRGLSEDEIRIGRNTYNEPFPTEDMYLGYSWHQNGIFAARLGLFDEAWKYLQIKLDDGPYRFPTFWGPGHDWMPDHNHGGSGMVGLQEMLLQINGDDLSILPAWDLSIDVQFKLHTPDGRVVEAEIKNGEVKTRISEK